MAKPSSIPKRLQQRMTFLPRQPREVAWSRRIIAAHAEATSKGQGVVVVDGRLIENLHVENAQRVVQLAVAIADLTGEPQTPAI